MPIATKSSKIDITQESVTASLAKKFSKVFKNGDIVFLYGERHSARIHRSFDQTRLLVIPLLFYNDAFSPHFNVWCVKVRIWWGVSFLLGVKALSRLESADAIHYEL